MKARPVMSHNEMMDMQDWYGPRKRYEVIRYTGKANEPYQLAEFDTRQEAQDYIDGLTDSVGAYISTLIECEICCGDGELFENYGNGAFEVPCHACNGKCFVESEIGDE
jgi:hypothetical protein